MSAILACVENLVKGYMIAYKSEGELLFDPNSGVVRMKPERGIGDYLMGSVLFHIR